VRFLLALLGLLLVAPIPVAKAQSSPAEEEARQHFVAGQKLLDGARWAPALSEFQQSYALAKYPALLYKIAFCEDQLGRAAEALADYRRYLESDPQTGRREWIEARIEALRRAAGQPPVAAPEAEKAREPLSVPPAALPVAAAATEDHPSPRKRRGLWIGLGVGAAAVVAGVITAAALATRPPDPHGGTLAPSVVDVK
jgi:tetratricopeptide (TPR) repeat protein